MGALTLLFLAQRLLFPPRADAPPPPRWVGFGLATASGFTSFVAHAGSPPLSVYLLPLRLKPITFAGTSAVFFAAVNLAKWLPYAWLGLIDRANMATSLLLLPLAPLGVWLGVWLARRIEPTLVLPRGLRRHGRHRRQAAVGRPALKPKKSPRPSVAAGSLPGHRPGLRGRRRFPCAG